MISALLRCEISKLRKPKERRWIAYNSLTNEAMSRGFKTKSDCYNSMFGNKFRDEYQYIEIEVNV